MTGEADLLSDIDVRGQTVVNRVKLLSSSAVPGIILQKYEFELSCGGERFYRGASAFGYFTLEALNNQAGFGGGEAAPSPDSAAEWIDVDMPPAAQDHVDFLQQAWVAPGGGRHGLGRVYAETLVRPTDWFFKCHFETDPVMPGCLGVDALWQLVGFYLGWAGSPGRGRALGAGEIKFFGQVLPTAKKITYHLHLSRVIQRKLVMGVADGHVFVDGREIYQATDLKVGLFTSTDNF